jgi:hypothetical protein
MVEEKKDKRIFEKEIEPLIGETPTVIIKGKEYKMRRLGMADTFKLARIIAIGAAGIGKEISSLEMTAESAIGLLIVGFPYADQQILNLFADVLGVKNEEIRNPDVFPMGTEIDLIKALVEHIDVKAFFLKLTGLLEMPILKEFLKKTSTLSRKDMVGLMKK